MKNSSLRTLIFLAGLLASATGASAAYADTSLVITGTIDPSLTLMSEIYFVAGNHIPVVCGLDEMSPQGGMFWHGKEYDRTFTADVQNGTYRMEMDLSPPLSICGYSIGTVGDIQIRVAGASSSTPSQMIDLYINTDSTAANSPVSMKCGADSNGFTSCSFGDSIHVNSGTLNLDLY
jgi:hypothetical protein